jgi:AraC-like DNA-binding protein
VEFRQLRYFVAVAEELSEVKQMISESDLALKEVAARCGFKTVQHMTAVFGRAFGQTPGRYRQSKNGIAPNRPARPLAYAESGCS